MWTVVGIGRTVCRQTMDCAHRQCPMSTFTGCCSHRQDGYAEFLVSRTQAARGVRTVGCCVGLDNCTQGGRWQLCLAVEMGSCRALPGSCGRRLTLSIALTIAVHLALTRCLDGLFSLA
ncbi:hypothetical protein Salat_1128900 [Sesamum alatum]|uniref:Uncharacterized protein n=1 Tax=Sesamum alatum TaxID=300844 RepID=A0AAE1YET4_9LAMI|nr:hypothetical protein Salat_1128900 [Sesamum alatum]